MNDHRFDLIGYPPPYGLLVANKTSCPDVALEMRPEAWPPSQSQAHPPIRSPRCNRMPRICAPVGGYACPVCLPTAALANHSQSMTD